MLIDDLIEISECLRCILLPRKGYFDQMTVEIGKEIYNLKFEIDMLRGFHISLNKIGSTDQFMIIFSNKGVLFKILNYSRHGYPISGLKLNEEQHIYKYLSWDAEDLNKYINILKEYVVMHL